MRHIPLIALVAILAVGLLVACEETTPKPPRDPVMPPAAPVTIEEVRGKTAAALALIPDLPSGYLQPLRADLVALQAAVAEANATVRTLATASTTPTPGQCPPQAEVENVPGAALVTNVSAPMVGCYPRPLPGRLLTTLDEIRDALKRAIASDEFPPQIRAAAAAALRSLDTAPPMAQASTEFHGAMVRVLEGLVTLIQGIVDTLPAEAAEVAAPLEQIIESLEGSIERLDDLMPYVIFLPTDEALRLMDGGIALVAELDVPGIGPILAALRDLRREWAALRP